MRSESFFKVSEHKGTIEAITLPALTFSSTGKRKENKRKKRKGQLIFFITIENLPTN